MGQRAERRQFTRTIKIIQEDIHARSKRNPQQSTILQCTARRRRNTRGTLEKIGGYWETSEFNRITTILVIITYVNNYHVQICRHNQRQEGPGPIHQRATRTTNRPRNHRIRLLQAQVWRQKAKELKAETSLLEQFFQRRTSCLYQASTEAKTVRQEEGVNPKLSFLWRGKLDAGAFLSSTEITM